MDKYKRGCKLGFMNRIIWFIAVVTLILILKTETNVFASTSGYVTPYGRMEDVKKAFGHNNLTFPSVPENYIYSAAWYITVGSVKKVTYLYSNQPITVSTTYIAGQNYLYTVGSCYWKQLDENASSVDAWLNSSGNYGHVNLGTVLGQDNTKALLYTSHNINLNGVSYVDASVYVEQVNIPLDYLQMNLCYQYPYYMMVQKDASRKYFVASNRPFYMDKPDNYIHRASEAIYSVSYNNGEAWSMMQNCGGNTKILGGITPVNIQYLNFDLYATDVTDTNTSEIAVENNKTSELGAPKNEIDDLRQYTMIYRYEHDGSIENVDNMMIVKQALYRSDWGFVIGESKTKYDITWSPPSVTGYRLEIAVQSVFEDETRRWLKQSFCRSWDGNGNFITAEQGKFEVDIGLLGKVLLSKVWSDTDTGSYFSIPPTELYFRYIIKDEATACVKYGNWTRLDMKGGSNGIIEAVKDNVTTNETVNPDGTTSYEDVPIDGNVTEYLNPGTGEQISEEQSMTGAVDSVENALANSTVAIKNVGEWVGQVPALITQLFGFIPEEIIAFIGLSIVVLMILKIAGR